MPHYNLFLYVDMCARIVTPPPPHPHPPGCPAGTTFSGSPDCPDTFLNLLDVLRRRHNSPVELHYNLEQIAIEFFIVGSCSGGHSECPKQNRPKSDYRKYPNLHKFNMAATESFVGLYLPNAAF